MEDAPMTERLPEPQALRGPDPKHPECQNPVCQTGEFGPSHDGGTNCRNASKSIASGGTASHCTCDWCF